MKTKSSKLKLIYSLLLSPLIALILFSCTSTPDQSSYQPPMNSPVSSGAMNTGTPSPVPVESVPAEELAVPELPSFTFQKGVLVTGINPDFVQEVINQSSPNPIQILILADPAIQAVDQLLYQPDWMEKVQAAARTAQSQSLKTYLWSREINMEGSSFVFANDTPLVVARQTAYRNVLQKAPELNGFVISFEDALLPPWKAASVMQGSAMNAAQRVLFVIQMIRQVVVDEMDKQLFIYVPAAMPESIYVTDAVKAMNDERIVIITSSSEIASLSPLNGKIKVHWLADVSSNESGLISAMPNELTKSMAILNPDQHAGMTVIVGNDIKPVWDTVNGVNWQIFTSWTPGIALHETVWDDWIQQVLGTLPVSDEGRLLRNVLQEGTHHSIALQALLTDHESQNSALSNDFVRNIQNLYSQPNQQLLTDLAQERFEYNVWCSSAKQNAEQILQPVMRPKIYQDLIARLEYMQFLTSVQHYAEQCLLGFQVWKSTRNELEALYLESHLLSLENLIQSGANQKLSSNLTNQLSQLVTQIRSEFPQVLIGAVPRDWNKITGIRIQQVNTNEVVLYWQTDFPSRTRVLLTGTNALMNRVIDGDNREVIYHQSVINGLQPSQNYTVKIQCMTPDGKITNSGTIPLRLDSLSL